MLTVIAPHDYDGVVGRLDTLIEALSRNVSLNQEADNAVAHGNILLLD